MPYNALIFTALGFLSAFIYAEPSSIVAAESSPVATAAVAQVPVDTPTPSRTSIVITPLPNGTAIYIEPASPTLTQTPTPSPVYIPPTAAEVSIDDVPLNLTDPRIADITGTRLEKIDALIRLIWPVWVQAQNDYRALTGRYCQGLPSHAKVPESDEGDYPDGWFTSPTDQQYRIKDMGALRLDKMAFSVRMDVYDGPEGKGWVACVYAIQNNTLYERCLNYGPEAKRETDGWVEVDQ